MKSSGGKRKRLVLVEPEETSQEAEAKLNSTEESPDEDVNSRNQRKYSAAESETEKHDESHDGVRRSQRAKRQIYYNCNDSWIFAEKNVKVSLFFLHIFLTHWVLINTCWIFRGTLLQSKKKTQQQKEMTECILDVVIS